MNQEKYSEKKAKLTKIELKYFASYKKGWIILFTVKWVIYLDWLFFKLYIKPQIKSYYCSKA